MRWDLLSEAWTNKTEDDFQSDIALDKGFIRLKPNQSGIEKKLPLFIHHKQSFSKMVEKDMQASGLMNALQDRVGHAKNITNNGKFELTYNKWWDDKTQINEKWYVIKSNNLFFKSDMVWVYPYDMATYNLIIARYYGYGLADTLDNICSLIKRTECMVLSLGFIVVSETSKTQSGDDSWHVDFSLLSEMYTVILPVVLPSSKEPELMFKHQLTEKRGSKDIILNYKYKEDILLAFPADTCHATKQLGNKTSDNRVMLSFTAGWFNDKIPDFMTEINRMNFNKDKISSAKLALEWREQMSHTKGSKSWK